MLPYVHPLNWQIGPLPVHGFGILVALGVIIGTYLARRRAERKGIAPVLSFSIAALLRLSEHEIGLVRKELGLLGIEDQPGVGYQLH